LENPSIILQTITPLDFYTLMLLTQVSRLFFGVGKLAASNMKEACSLIEFEFEYVTGEYNDGGKIFRNRRSS